MPCIFGAVGHPHEGSQRERPGDHFSSAFGSVETRCWPGAWLGAHAHAPSRAIGTDSRDRAFAVYGERDMYRAVSAQETGNVLYNLSDSGAMEITAEARGNIAVYDPRLERVTIALDWVSFFPLYYTASKGRLLFSSHLKPLADAVRADVDWTGVAEFLTQNWCLNGRTIFKGIRRLLPGQSLAFTRGDKAPAISETSRLWTDDAWTGAPATTDTYWELLCASVNTAWSDGEPVGLMMSGGWDSRLLLAAFLATRGPKRITTFTHGDPGSVELRISRAVADETGLAHVEVPLERDAFGGAEVHDELFGRCESLLFPYWRLAAQQAHARGIPVLACGLMGEVIGGHYMVRGNDSAQIRQYLKQLLFRSEGRNGRASVEESFRQVFRSVRGYRKLWYLRPDVFADSSRAIADEIEHDIDQELARYRARGIASERAILEAYVVEHRALMMLANPPLASQSYVDVLMPYASRRLMAATLSMPFEQRFERSMCQRLLNRYQPALLRLPLAATVWLPARAPMVLHQGARLVRRGIDVASERIEVRTRGRFKRSRRIGWMNFDRTLRGGMELEAIAHSLKSDLFAHDAIAQRIQAVREYRSPVKLGHVYLKMAWLDRMLSGAMDAPPTRP